MARLKPRVKDLSSELVGRVAHTLVELGFGAGAIRNRPAGSQGALAILTYEPRERSASDPYLTVAVYQEGTILGLLSPSGFGELGSRYLALTDGSAWAWYALDGDGGEHPVVLSAPPPPPTAPPGGRWLEPLRDKRVFKHLLQTMSAILRDSHGGGIVERFDVISKILFTKVYDEREVLEGDKKAYELQVEADDTVDSVSRRAHRVWERAHVRYDRLRHNGTQELTEDSAALYRIVGLLQDVSLLTTPGDAKGLAYEEVLRNTFEKNENQQFFTPHEVVEFMVGAADLRPEWSVCDPACGTGGFLVEAARLAGPKLRLVGADVDQRLARVAQMNLIMHGADDAQIHYLSGNGSLAPLDSLAETLPARSFDLILTNPPFGSDLTDHDALQGFQTGRGRSSRRRSILFVERCLDLLRPGGRLGIILDDSVLNLPSTTDVRQLIVSRATVEAVVSLPDVAFMPYSTAKSSIVFLRKRTGAEGQEPVFMAEAAEVGRRPNGDPLYSEERDAGGNRLLLNDFPHIAAAYASFRQTGVVDTPNCFVTLASRLEDRLDIYYYHPKRFAAEQEILGCPWPTPALEELVEVRRQPSVPSGELGDAAIRWLGLADISEGTGEFEVKVVPADRIKSATHAFRGGDILFSKLRPNLRKVVLIPDDDEGGLCSSEIIVLRGLDKVAKDAPAQLDLARRPVVDSTYLAFMLRSDLVYGQLMYRVTGVGRPRVSPETVLSVRIPLPPPAEQERIVREFQRAWAESLAARNEASAWLRRSEQVISTAYDRVIQELTSGSQK